MFFQASPWRLSYTDTPRTMSFTVDSPSIDFSPLILSFISYDNLSDALSLLLDRQ